MIEVFEADPAGASIPRANRELKDLATNDVRRAQTSAVGTYIFPNLGFGTYQLTVTGQGFQSQIFEGVQVQTARNTSINATLQAGVTTPSVTVAANEVSLMETDSSVLASTIDTKQVRRAPLQPSMR